MTFHTRADFAAALATLPQPDFAAIIAAKDRQSQLTKPAGSLGRLEDIAVFMAGWQGQAIPSIKRGKSVVFAGNHGVTVHGVSAFPAAVTAQMVQNFHNGGAAINALAKAAGLDLQVVELDLEQPTADFTCAPAMTDAECLAALCAGAAVVDADLDILVLGEMGIGNSTAAAALCLRSFGGTASDWVGPGTGLDCTGLSRKETIVARALAFHASSPIDPFETLKRVGGREIAAIAGAILRARQLSVPIVLDGFICSSALAPLAKAAPSITAHCIAGHCSAEPGHARLLERLGLTPLLHLNMRLGEGSGAAVAVPLIRFALAAHAEMATFADAGISDGS